MSRCPAHSWHVAWCCSCREEGWWWYHLWTCIHRHLFRYCHGLLLNPRCLMISFQFSYSHCLIIVAGILLPDFSPEHFCFFLRWVRLPGTLIAVPQRGVYFGDICGEEFVDGTSFILTIISFQPAARATRHCFAVSREVMTRVFLSFLNHSWFLVAFPWVISLSLLTSNLNLLIFPAVAARHCRCLGQQ